MNKYMPVSALAAISALSLGASALSGVTFQSVSGTISGDVTWSSSTQYILEEPVFVTGTLTIQAGTIVRGQPRNDTDDLLPGSLIVTRSGRIEINGTASAPVIFTTAALDTDSDDVPDGEVDDYDRLSTTEIAALTSASSFYDSDPVSSPLGCLNGDGDANTALWGGVVILGNAPTNVGNADGLGCGLAYIEGFSVPNTNTVYGGYDPNDDSGVISYVSIRYGGDELAEANEINGLTLGGVGSSTLIDHVEIFCNYDDGIEVFGGTVNLKHCAVFGCGDDQFDFDQGYTGNCQFMLAVLPTFTIGSEDGDELCEWDGDDAGDSNVSLRSNYSDNTTYGPCPLSNPNVYNMTLIGTGSKGRILMRNGFCGHIYNSIVVNSGSASALSLETSTLTGWNPAAFATSGLLSIGYTTFDDVPGVTSGSSEETALNNGGSNYFNPSGFSLEAEGPSCCGNDIDPRPYCSTDDPVYSVVDLPGNSFFETAGYRGAFDPDALELWTDGWTVGSAQGWLAAQ